jgi:hypothetical protein
LAKFPKNDGRRLEFSANYIELLHKSPSLSGLPWFNLFLQFST